MKTARIIIGIVLVLIGVVWCLQGLNILLGSVMSGHIRWVILGGAEVVVGVVLLILNVKKKQTPPGGAS
jgi:hypothetical protein